jgi:hypothetical protein
MQPAQATLVAFEPNNCSSRVYSLPLKGIYTAVQSIDCDCNAILIRTMAMVYVS